MGIPEESLQRLLVLRREMERIFRDFLDPEQSDMARSSERPELPLDVYEVEGDIVIEVELPGVRREDIELSVLRDVLIIEGDKPRRRSENERQHICMERSFGPIRRIIEIPIAGDTRHIRAELDNGVLRIRLPKIEERRGRRRKVEIG
jgi:HSP20 family protein